MNSADSLAEATTVCPDSQQPSALPFALETVIITRQEFIQLKAEVQYYKAQHERSLKREAELLKQIEKYKAQIRDLRQRYFGRRSEKCAKHSEQSQGSHTRGVRGQRRGSRGHGRRRLPQLPVREQTVDLEEANKLCPKCSLPLRDCGLTQDSDTVEIEVQAYIRRVKRKRYHPSCQCGVLPGIVTAPPAPRLIPKGKHGVSVWVEVLLQKYHYCQPTSRLLQNWNCLGLKLSQGSLIGGMKQLKPLFAPLIKAFKAQQLRDEFFHADETLWRIFEQLAGKIGYRWYLWVFRSRTVCFYLLDPSRAARVPLAHFAQLLSEAIVVCDRYSAYKKMARTLGILLAFCWAHVRRDFLEVARGYPQLQPWAGQWVERIGALYHENQLRLQAQPDPEQFALSQARLRELMTQMVTARDQELADAQLHPAARKVLKSLHKHWAGLSVFVEHPEIPMDNNAAEQAARNPVCGRKNYFGSGSKWAGEFAAMMFTVFMTLVYCWQINPRLWLTEYLNACARNNGVAPADLTPFLPWAMTPERLAFLRGPVPTVKPIDSS